jgi:hypothetical protein
MPRAVKPTTKTYAVPPPVELPVPEVLPAEDPVIDEAPVESVPAEASASVIQIKGTKDVLRKDKVGKSVPSPKRVTTVSAPHTTVHSVYYN